MKSVFSNVTITPLKNKLGSMIGNGSVTVAGAVEIKFVLRTGRNGYFASLPSHKGNKQDENGKDIWYPDVKILENDLYNEFQNLVKKEAEKVMGGGQSTAGEEDQSDGVPF